jgi:hypothetical protein
MFQDAMDLSDSAMFELRRRLEAYADARLTPSLDASIRMRMSVMGIAHRRAALMAATPAVDAAPAITIAVTAERSRSAARAWRRPAAALAAASLALALVTGTVYASKAGGLLYTSRIWVEMANLPANVIDRAHAEIGRLDARIQEAQEASTAGDAPAAQAALAAYSSIVIEAGQGSAGDPTAIAAIEIAISRHVVVLTALADNVPLPARAAVQRALTSSTKVLDDLAGADQNDGHDGATGGGLSGTTGADGSKPARPSQADGEPPGAAVEDGSKPDRGTQDAVQAPRDHAAPPPGQAHGGGPAAKDPADRSTSTPIPERKPAPTPEPGDS